MRNGLGGLFRGGGSSGTDPDRQKKRKNRGIREVSKVVSLEEQ